MSELLSRAVASLRDDSRAARACEYLDELWPRTRYPDHPAPTREEAAAAMAAVEDMRLVVRQYLGDGDGRTQACECGEQFRDSGSALTQEEPAVFRSIKDFATQWKYETATTQKCFDALTDASLSQHVHDDYRTLGRIAWHVTGTIKEMMERTGLTVDGPDEHAPVPTASKEIATAFGTSAKSLADAVRTSWTDDTLDVVDEMYGEKWSRGQTLLFLMLHQAHHRGQMNVLMRQAGLTCPGIYGPAKEEWAQWAMQPPAI